VEEYAMLSEPERAVGTTGLYAVAVVVAWRASTTCSDWRRAWVVEEWLLLGGEIELAVLGSLGCVVCGGFFLRTEVRADVSLVACCMLLRLSRPRRVPVRLITWTGDGGEVAVAVIEDARVAVVAAVVLASAAQGLGDIWRDGSSLSRLVWQLSQPISAWGQVKMGP
jgi:hypothetical protein